MTDYFEECTIKADMNHEIINDETIPSSTIDDKQQLTTIFNTEELACHQYDERQFFSNSQQNQSKIHKELKSHHVCNQCGKTYTNRSALKAHERNHLVAKCHQCVDCGKSFSYVSELKRHEQIHSSVKPYLCNQCGKTFTQKSSLQSHERIHFGTKFQCELCDKTFTQKSALHLHERIHLGIKPFQCQQCDKSYSRRAYLQAHERRHLCMKSLFKCKQCEKTFTSQTFLEEHERIHSSSVEHYHETVSLSSTVEHQSPINIKEESDCCPSSLHSIMQPSPIDHQQSTIKEEVELLFQCIECYQQFPNQDKLQLHSQIHKKLTPYKCDQCGKAFPHQSTLKAHLRNHLNNKPYKCDQCNKSFIYMSSLKRHEQIHASVKPFQCKHCSKSFTQKSALHSHERIHFGTKFKCSHCDKTFTQMSALRLHERIHLGIKYKCAHCDRPFNQMSALRYHERIHLGIRPFKCEHCGKRYSRRSDLRAHERKRLCMKSLFQCEHCHKTFGRRKLLLEHEKIHSDDQSTMEENISNLHEKKSPHRSCKIRPYKCAHCDKAFSYLSALNRHEHIHSGVKPYKCAHCDKAFSHPAALKTHERHHSGVGQYKCTQCDKAFFYKSYLKRHESIHTCTSKSDLTTTAAPKRLHRRKTAAAAPLMAMHNCTECDKSFTSVAELEHHQQQPEHCCSSSTVEEEHSNDLPTLPVFRCQYCEEIFPCQLTLDAHHERNHCETSSHDHILPVKSEIQDDICLELNFTSHIDELDSTSRSYPATVVTNEHQSTIHRIKEEMDCHPAFDDVTAI